MNTPTVYTPLESLLLFRGISQHGLDAPAFVRISEVLRNNGLIKNDPKYDAARLTPEALQELFLHFLWEELKYESEHSAVRTGSEPDGALSPASKKRKLQAPAPTLRDARQHVEKIKSVHDKLEDAYIRHAVAEIQDLEVRFDQLQGEIDELAALAGNKEAGEERISKSPNGTQQPGAQRDARLANGTGPSSGPSTFPSPKPATQVAPQPSPQPAPQIAPRQIIRNGSVPSQERPGAAPPTPALIQPPVASSTRPEQETPPPVPAVKPQEPSRPPNGAPQVLQPPQGVPPFQPHPQPVAPQAPAEGLQRPEGVARPTQPPTSQPPYPQQPPAQGQLIWEPLYQPNAPKQQVPIQQQQQQQQHQQHQQHVPLQPPSLKITPRPPPQQPVSHPPRPSPAPRPLQPQPNKAYPQQPVLIAPQNAAQYAPPLQPAPIRPAVELSPGPMQNRQPIAPSPGMSRAPQLSYQQPPVYHGYAHSPPMRHVTSAPPSASPAAMSPVPGHGLAPPQQQRPPQIPNLQAPSPYNHLGAPSAPPPMTAQPDVQSGYSSPYQAPRPSVPDHVQQQLQQRVSMGTPAPPARTSHVPPAPQTPSLAIPLRLQVGSGTKWARSTTPSTPKIGSTPRSVVGDIPSPAYEPLSPVLQPAALPQPPQPSLKETPREEPKQPSKDVAPKETLPNPMPQPVSQTAQDPETPVPSSKRRGRLQKSQAQDATLPPIQAVAVTPQTSQPVGQTASQPADSQPTQTPASLAKDQAQPKDEPKPAEPEPETELVEAKPVAPELVEPKPTQTKVEEPVEPKDEEATPRPTTETGDTTADESVTGRRKTTRQAKRKRRDSSPTPAQTPKVESQTTPMPSLPVPIEISPPNQVLWTRAFNKVSGSAMEQIVHHRSANMFAAPVRDRDAPGYRKVVLLPQDLKSIRAALSQGNRAAAQAAAALPGGDPGTSGVWLPLSEELVPPKGIINSAQLDRELAHMFSNAIMYNPDPGHGPGPTFLRPDAEDEDGDGQDVNGEGSLGYKVDEFSVVNDTRAMFGEVEKLMSELRSAEIRRSGPTGTPRHSSLAAGRETSVSAVRELRDRDEAGSTADGGDEATATEAETSGTVAKRRRTTRG